MSLLRNIRRAWRSCYSALVILGLAACPLAGCSNTQRGDAYGRLSVASGLVGTGLSLSEHAWHRYTSSNIELITDYPRDQAIEALRVFERAGVYLDQVLPYSKARTQDPLLVLLFRDPAQLRESSGNPMAVCTFMVQAPGSLDRRPMILAAGDNTQSMRLHWVHELTHYELYRRYGSLPAWLDEGLASYFSSIDDRGAQVMLGTPQRLWRFVDDTRGMRTKKAWTHRKTEVPRTWFLDASELVRTNYYQFHTSMAVSSPSRDDLEREVVNYAESWLLVHMLRHGPARYQRLYRESIASQSDPLKWGSTLSQMLRAIDPRELDRNLASYANKVSTPPMAVPMPNYRPAQIKIQVLSPTQTLEARSLALAEPQTLLSDLEREINKQATPDAQALRTLAWMQLQNEELGPAAKSLCRARKRILSGSSVDRTQLAKVLHLGLWIDLELRRKGRGLGCIEEDATQGTAWATALSRLARSSAQWHAAARIFGSYGEYERAYQLAEKAVGKDHSCWSCYESMAKLSFRLGNAKRAVSLLHSAIDWAPDALGEQYLNEQLEALDRYAQAANRQQVSRESTSSPPTLRRPE